MSQVLDELRYNESHEWVREEDDGTVTIGITDHAQAQLGDLVYVELPEVGRVVSANDSLGVVESVKAASDVYSPIGGRIVAVNEALPRGAGGRERDVTAGCTETTERPEDWSRSLDCDVPQGSGARRGSVPRRDCRRGVHLPQAFTATRWALRAMGTQNPIANHNP